MKLEGWLSDGRSLVLCCGEGILVILVDDRGVQEVVFEIGTMYTEDGVGLVLDLPDVYYRDERGRHVLLKKTGSSVLSYPGLELKRESKCE